MLVVFVSSDDEKMTESRGSHELFCFLLLRMWAMMSSVCFIFLVFCFSFRAVVFKLL